MQTIKRWLALMMALVLLVSCMPVTARAADEIARGECGQDAQWHLEDDGWLYITGTGRVDAGCWNDYILEIRGVYIGEGITSIAGIAFNGCANMLVLELPSTLITIETAAFCGCSALEEVVIPKNVGTIGSYGFASCTKLSKITFEKDAPLFFTPVFDGVTANVYYPAGNDTWTEDVMQQCGGNITWIPCEVDSSSNSSVPENSVSGSCGENATWFLNLDSGVLNVSGSGSITSNPWSSYSAYIREIIVEEGISGIEVMDAFSNCENLTRRCFQTVLPTSGIVCFICVKACRVQQFPKE